MDAGTITMIGVIITSAVSLINAYQINQNKSSENDGAHTARLNAHDQRMNEFSKRLSNVEADTKTNTTSLAKLEQLPQQLSDMEKRLLATLKPCKVDAE